MHAVSYPSAINMAAKEVQDKTRTEGTDALNEVDEETKVVVAVASSGNP